MNTYGHKTQPRTFQASPETFARMVNDGAIVQSDWMICPPPPSYNPSTEQTPQWRGGEWVVLSLTASDLAARAEAEADAADLDNEARIARALVADLKAGNGTTAQRLARVERVCAFLIRRFVL